MEKDLSKKLFNVKTTGWESVTDQERARIFEVSKNYIDFLNKSKTEREFIKSAKELADNHGFKDINDCESLKVGDKVYFVNRGKSMYLAVIGENSVENGGTHYWFSRRFSKARFKAKSSL